MVYKIKIEKFEGPLDLLLKLIEQEEMDITEVSLATVTDQYLIYLNTTADISTEELADFLVVAAKLLLIKSRSLLPHLHIVDEDEETDLEHQLKIYREFYEASRVLNKMLLKKKFLFSRERPAVTMEQVFNPPKSITSDKLKSIFKNILIELEPWVNLPSEIITRTISIKERIAGIKNMIQKELTLNFKKLLSTTKNRTDVIVTFLALLELVKQKTVVVTQEGIFDDIVVKQMSKEEINNNY